jgi:hypothetical protein
MMFGGTLDATGDSAFDNDRQYDAPMQFDGGVSARINRNLLAAAGVTWSRPPATEGETVTRDTWRVGGGVEFEGVRSAQRTYPVRIGARWGQLPYHLQGEEPATEWAVGGGVGFRLGNPVDPAAVFDLAVERGARNGLDGSTLPGGLSEKLWRVTISLSLFGS